VGTRGGLSAFVIVGWLTALSLGASSVSADVAPADLLQSRCGACHQHLDGGKLNRISAQRKTPEGWLMTITRMEQIHNLKLEEPERRALVKFLADTQGLAPSETKGFRYVLERRDDVVEKFPDEESGVICARCHSFAQLALQRRDAPEWLKTVHFHVAQWPTLEYQSRGRDRNWWDIASTRMPAKLAEIYPLSTPEWTSWRARQPADVSGEWRVVGRQPGKGAYEGRMAVTRGSGDEYTVATELRYAGGEKAAGSGKAIVYTGYEWRASLEQGGESVSQVLALSEAGDELVGRWFFTGRDSIGGDMRAVRQVKSDPRILSVEPSYVRAGQRTEVAIHGVGLAGDVSLGPGITIEPRDATPDTVRVVARVAADAAAGTREVAVGAARVPALFAIYKKIDGVRVEPDYAIARIGGDGGSQPAVPIQFDAIGVLAGPDGTLGTDDDVRLGTMKATWSVEDNGAIAKELHDAKFAGVMKPSGLFMPAAAGPNPKRPYRTNNAGDLTVRASVNDGGKSVVGTAHLVVSVQRWRNPPIR
jgi:quinohemoprotein amine dehydrogenase